MNRATRLLLIFVALLVALPLAIGHSQNPDTQQKGVVRLRVRVKQTDTAPLRGLARKRFFLIHGSLEQNRALTEAIDRQPLVTRDCYYSKNGASPALINWLKEADCESVYCRDSGAGFRHWTKSGAGVCDRICRERERIWRQRNRAEMVNHKLPAKLTRRLLSRPEDTLSTHCSNKRKRLPAPPVQSVMTDRNGTAFFTDLAPGTYVISNLIPAEIGQSLATWTCEIQIKPDDLAGEKPFLISNRKDRLVKCVAREKPTPACQ